MRVFAAAPHHADLPDVTIEVSAIDRHHQAVICRGYVDEATITEKLEKFLENGPVDVFVWATHGNREGMLLSTGILPTSGVRQYQRRSRCRLAILNTCESEDVARSVMIGGSADMICTVGQIDNQDAIRLGSLLMAELAKTDDFYEAYHVIDPDDGTYKYLQAKAITKTFDSPRKRLMPDEATELRQAIDQLRQSMNTSTVTMTELKGTMSMNNALTQKSMDSLVEQFTVFKAQLAARAPIWIAYLTVIFLAVIAFAVTIVSVVLISQRGG